MQIFSFKMVQNDSAYKYLFDFLEGKFSSDPVKNLLWSWYCEGIKKKASYLLDVRNIESNENFAAFVYNPDDLSKQYQRHHDHKVYEVIGVYNLNDKRNEDLLKKKKKPIS